MVDLERLVSIRSGLPKGGLPFSGSLSFLVLDKDFSPPPTFPWQKLLAVPQTSFLVILGTQEDVFSISVVKLCTTFWPMESGHNRCVISSYIPVV